MAKDDRLPEDFFDYNEITDEHKEAAAEVLKYLDERGAVPDYLSSRLRVKFGIKEARKVNVNNSKVYNLAREFGIYCKENGYMTDEDGSQIPMLQLEADMHRLDEFLEYAIIMSTENTNVSDLDSTESSQ